LKQVSSGGAALQNRDRTQFRLMTQDVRTEPGARMPKPLIAAGRIPAPPTQFVSPASLPSRPETTPAPTPVPPTAVATPPPAAAPARVPVSSFAHSPDPGATLLDVDLLHGALEQDLAGRPGTEEALAQDVAAAAYPLYVEYRKAWRKLYDTLQSKAGQLPLAQRAGLAEVLERQMPTLYQEEQFRAFAGTGPAVDAGAIRVGPGPADRLLSVFASAYGAAERRLETSEDVDGFLDRLGDLLETFATSFIELRRGQAEFGNQIAVRTITSDTPVRRARTPKELLHLLLAPGRSGAVHLDDLKAGFGEVMFHQVALLERDPRRVKALLEELDPGLLARLQPSPRRVGSRAGLPLARGPVDPLATLLGGVEAGDEEQALRILFGPEFARAYALVMGGQLSPAKSPRPNSVSRTAKKPA
jgi:hypothetical protein